MREGRNGEGQRHPGSRGTPRTQGGRDKEEAFPEFSWNHPVLFGISCWAVRPIHLGDRKSPSAPAQPGDSAGLGESQEFVFFKSFSICSDVQPGLGAPGL